MFCQHFNQADTHRLTCKFISLNIPSFQNPKHGSLSAIHYANGDQFGVIRETFSSPSSVRGHFELRRIYAACTSISRTSLANVYTLPGSSSTEFPARKVNCLALCFAKSLSVKGHRHPSITCLMTARWQTFATCSHSSLHARIPHLPNARDGT